MPRYASTFSGELRTVALNVQLTPTERAELDRLASIAGLRLSDYARRACLSGQAVAPAAVRRSDLAEKIMAGEIARLEAELSRLGNNLNQMAKRANQVGQVRSEEALERMLEMIEAELVRLREIVGKAYPA